MKASRLWQRRSFSTARDFDCFCCFCFTSLKSKTVQDQWWIAYVDAFRCSRYSDFEESQGYCRTTLHFPMQPNKVSKRLDSLLWNCAVYLNSWAVLKIVLEIAFYDAFPYCVLWQFDNRGSIGRRANHSVINRQ